MESTKRNSFSKLSDTSVYLFTAVILTLFLGYIDEGYYNFEWMTEWENWIAFVIYTSVFFLAQLGFSLLTAKILPVQIRRILSLLIGLPVGMIFLILIFYQSLGK